MSGPRSPPLPLCRGLYERYRRHSRCMCLCARLMVAGELGCGVSVNAVYGLERRRCHLVAVVCASVEVVWHGRRGGGVHACMRRPWGNLHSHRDCCCLLCGASRVTAAVCLATRGRPVQSHALNLADRLEVNFSKLQMDVQWSYAV